MRSLIGESTYYNKDKTNPYIAYAYGIKEEGKRFPAMFSSPDLALNALMQSIIDKVLENKDKDIVWRELPRVHQEVLFNEYNEPVTYYKAYARFCFE